MTDQSLRALSVRPTAPRSRRRPLAALTLAALAVAALACGEEGTPLGPARSGGDGGVLPGDTSTALGFVRERAGAPLISSTASFYAVKGQDRHVRLYYIPPNPGAVDTVDFMTFHVGATSLDRRPDGTAFADGDSVLITVTLANADSLIVQFAPQGLRFSTTSPARLHYNLSYTDPDRTRDGVVNATDDSLTKQLLVWRQESPGQAWTAQSSFLNLTDQYVETDVLGFTGYAVAYRSAQ